MIHQPTSIRKGGKNCDFQAMDMSVLHGTHPARRLTSKQLVEPKNPSRLGVRKFFQQFCEFFGDKLIQKIAKNNSQQKPKMILDTAIF